MTDLHLVQASLRLRAFTEWALHRGFLTVPRADGRGRSREPDLGYALHAALTGLFGGIAPRPFSVLSGDGRSRAPLGPHGGGLPVLGYSVGDANALLGAAQLAAQEFRDLWDWEGLRARAVPGRLPAGLRVSFDLRACPVKRRKMDLPFTTNLHTASRKSVTFSAGGTEVDAFQLATVRAEQRGEPQPRRDAVYAEWLGDRFSGTEERKAPLRLVPGSVRVRSCRSTRLLRRPRDGNGRVPRWLTRPEVWFSGQADVVDGAALPEFLARGIGRHCGFGFGMMLLRPA